MTAQELEELRSDLRAVRKAVTRHSPLLREMAATAFFARLSLPYALLVIAFGVGTQILLGSSGGFADLPTWWKTGFWILLALVLVVGAALKLSYLRRRAAEARPSAGLMAVYLSVFGGGWLQDNLGYLLVFAGSSCFAVMAGHPWYILAGASIWFGLALNSMGKVVRRGEYFASGWYGLAAGTASLFVIERAPWLWLAILVGGIFLVFALGGLFVEGRRPPAGDAPAGEGE